MSFRLTLLAFLFLSQPAALASNPVEDAPPSDSGLPDQSREALRELVGGATLPHMIDRRPGILGPPTSFPTGENAAYYMDEVRLQPREPENTNATPREGDGAPADHSE